MGMEAQFISFLICVVPRTPAVLPKSPISTNIGSDEPLQQFPMSFCNWDSFGVSNGLPPRHNILMSVQLVMHSEFECVLTQELVLCDWLSHHIVTILNRRSHVNRLSFMKYLRGTYLTHVQQYCTLGSGGSYLANHIIVLSRQVIVSFKPMYNNVLSLCGLDQMKFAYQSILILLAYQECWPIFY